MIDPAEREWIAMHRWKKWIAAVTIGVAAIGVTACDNTDDPDEIEQQLDQLEEDVRDNTP